MDNFDLRKYLAEGRLFKESTLNEVNTPRYPEGKLSVEDKIKAIVPLWQQLQGADSATYEEIKDEINKYTTYDNPNGGGSYSLAIADEARSAEDVAKIVKKEEAWLASSAEPLSTHSVELLVPKVYFNVETGELSGNKNEWYTDDELQAGADQTSYTSGEELDDMVFSNDYDQAFNFSERYPNLIKIT